MGPSLDLFENFRHIFADDTYGDKVQGTKKEHGYQYGCYAARSQLREKQFGEHLRSHDNAGEEAAA